jgi:hypothetical protein
MNVTHFHFVGGIGGCAGVLQLSEPLLWFILRVLSSEEALEKFIVMGGIQASNKVDVSQLFTKL